MRRGSLSSVCLRGGWASRSWVCLVGLLAGCLEPGAQQCGDGSVCPPGLTCATVAATTICARPDQFTACADAADGIRCATPDIVVGVCTAGVCISSGCGNGITESGEACDDGNLASGDGCSADCLSDETCGNRITDRGEQCDCGTAESVNADCPGPNSDVSGPCRLDCRLRCGDGIISPDEGCDPAASTTVSCAGELFDRGLTTCSASCQPVISVDTCRYIGFRTRTKQVTMPTPQQPLVTDLAPTSASSGFFIRGNLANTYDNFVAVGNAYVSNTQFAAIWTDGPMSAIAVGAQGKIVHNTGTWASQASGTSADLRDVWGRSPSDAYAVGIDTVVHWNGSTWSSLAPPTGAYRGVAGDSTRVFVVGDQGKVIVYSGAQWTTEDAGTTADLEAVWVANGIVVAVGSGGTIVERRSNGTWTNGRSNATATLRSVWGSAADGFFAVGDRGTVLFYDEHVWRPLALGRGVTGAADQDFISVMGVPSQAVGIVGTVDIASYEGAAWSPSTRPTPQTLNGLWGSGPDDIYAVGRNGTILHHDGLSWAPQPSPTTSDLHAIHGLTANDIYAVGTNRTLLHYNGSQWTSVTTGTGTLSSVFAITPSNVVVSATDGIYRYDGAALTRLSTEPSHAVWASSANDVWTAGTTIDHFDGVAWTTAITTSARALVGSSASDVYAVGASSFHFDGTAWASGPFEDSRLTAVCTTADHGAFAVGREGTLRFWGGFAVEPFVSRTTTDLAAVFMTKHVLVMAGADGTLDTMVFHR